MTTVRLAVDEPVGDRYVVLSILGEGGMGQVALVRQNLTNKLGAMKLLTAIAPELVERFNREAAAPSRLNHPAFPAVFDFGTHHGAPYIVMDFVDGETISGAMKRGHRFSLAEIVEIGRQICDAMGTAHDAGLVHRDIKAENIMLAAKANGAPRVYVLDLGIAKFSTEAQSDLRTKTGMMLGTPMTMSPEQAQGKRVDLRSDVYSLGCVLFLMATGRYPFEAAEPLQLAMKHVLEEPPFATDVASWVPHGVAQILERTLQKEENHRYQTMAELDEALALFGSSNAAPEQHTGRIVTQRSQGQHVSGQQRAVSGSGPAAKTATPRPAATQPFGPNPLPGATQPLDATPVPHAGLNTTLGSLSESNGQMGPRGATGGGRGLSIAGALVVATLTAGGTWYAMRPSSGPAIAPPALIPVASAPAPTAVPTPAPTPKPAAPVASRIRLSVHPPEARIIADGKNLGEQRLLEGLPGVRRPVELRAEGYEPKQVELVFTDRDEVQTVELTKLAAAKAPTKPGGKTERKPKASNAGKSGRAGGDFPDEL